MRLKIAIWSKNTVQLVVHAKMKILKPELDALREKYKGNKAKAQRETMALQNKAGASPLSGCLQGILQIPVFYSLFMFFPIVSKIISTGILFLKPTMKAIAEPIKRTNWFEPSKDESP